MQVDTFPVRACHGDHFPPRHDRDSTDRMTLFAAALLIAPCVWATHAPVGACSSHSPALLDALLQGDYARAGTDFDATVAATLKATKGAASQAMQVQSPLGRLSGALTLPKGQSRLAKCRSFVALT